MPELNAATGALTVPIWAVGAAAAVFLVLIMLAVAQAGTAMVVNTVFRASIVIAIASSGWIYVQRSERQERAEARRALDERSAALLARAVAPGSALSCLNELAGDAVEAACEKAVFASPEAVSAAVSYVTAELAFLADASDHARRVDPAYASELAPLRAALELDRFGIVAHVLAQRGCTAEKCDALDLFTDASHVIANLRNHVFDDRVTKFTALWNNPLHEEAAAAVARPLLHAPIPPQYDLPSADSIPPISIMVPEPGSRTDDAKNEQASHTPMPPRRPHSFASTHAHAPRPPAPAAPPVDVGEAPTDGAGTAAPQR